MVTINKAFRYSVLFAALFAFISFEAEAQGIDGAKIFKSKCGSCHKIDKKLIGPPLNEATDNWKGDTEAMYTWVRNWSEAVEKGKAGDARFARAVEMENYDASAMTLFPELDNEQLDAVFAYIANPPVPDGGGGGTGVPDGVPTGPKVNWLLISVLGLLFLLSLILGRISNNVERLVLERDGLPVPPQKTLSQRVFNKKLLGFLALLAFGFIGYSTYVNAAGLGRSMGYKPEQPIAFSHKLHAGTLQVECQYCHSSAAVSKSASIPSTNICMNCHKGVQEGPTGETKEIQKIYDATGFNPVNLQYDKEPQGPVEWTRIHNLPDHVFFSHAQHVSAGKVECQTCHGPVEEMDVLQQHSNLSMGWCINCHRETKVQFTENAYYADIFDEYHEKIKEGKMDFVTVEKIGGLECQKCHY